MLTLEFKLKGKAQQYRIIDEMIRTAQFVRNKTLKYWTENQGVKLIDLYKQCAFLEKRKALVIEKKRLIKLGRKHLKVSRQRKDFAIKTALYAVKSNDFVAHEDLQVKNMVKNHKLAKSISDAAWSLFAQWLEYFGKVYDKTVIAVAPQYTSQDCSSCGNTVKKTLSTRTHICGCGTILDRDHNAAKNILAKGLKAHAGINLNTAGHAEINAWGQTDLYSLVVTSTSKLTD